MTRTERAADLADLSREELIELVLDAAERDEKLVACVRAADSMRDWFNYWASQPRVQRYDIARKLASKELAP